MISVLNHLQQLSGNKSLLYISCILLIVSCGTLSATRKSEVVLQPVEDIQTNHNTQSNGVVVVTDNKKNQKHNKNNTVVFMGQTFQVPASNVDEYKIAVILPFCFNKDGKLSEQLRSVSMEYFEGVELALEELRNKGVNVHTEVFDSQNDSNVVANLLKQDYLKKIHLIIGPVYDHELRLVERHCSVYGIPLVSPLRFYAKKNRTSVPVFNPVSDDSNRHYFAALQLIRYYGSHKFVLYNDNTAEGFPARRAFVRAFTEMKKTLPTVTLDALKSTIADGKDIIVIAPVKSDVSVHHLLNLVAGKKHVQVVGLDDWFDFPIIPFATWAKCNLMFYNNNTVNQQDSEILLFNENYSYKYGGMPGKLSYIGYDQALFFVEALSAFGSNFGAYIQDNIFPLKHTSFQFTHMSNDSYANKFVNLLRLNADFELEKIN
ncbi:MAG: ABC transporter substrate-binding protein [Bacteroidia bacterium]|nr:ABC transporter substrate-binding protein [Bacteroidia bacterium]